MFVSGAWCRGTKMVPSLPLLSYGLSVSVKESQVKETLERSWSFCNSSIIVVNSCDLKISNLFEQPIYRISSSQEIDMQLSLCGYGIKTGFCCCFLKKVNVIQLVIIRVKWIMIKFSTTIIILIKELFAIRVKFA